MFKPQKKHRRKSGSGIGKNNRSNGRAQEESAAEIVTEARLGSLNNKEGKRKKERTTAERARLASSAGWGERGGPRCSPKATWTGGRCGACLKGK